MVTCAPGLGDGPLGVIEHGALAARDGRIVWVGSERDLRTAVETTPGAREIDAGGNAVLPGLVDCHTHLVFAGDRRAEFAARARGEAYKAGGVWTTVEATRAATDQDLTDLARARLDRFALHGVTTVEAKSGYGLDIAQEIRLVRIAAALGDGVVPTFLGAHIPPRDLDRGAYVEQVCEAMSDARTAGAVFADVWCDEGAFTVEESARILTAAREAGLDLKIHAEQLARTGGAMLAAQMRATSADHLENATDADARALAAAGTVAVLLPGASIMTGASFAPARMLIEAGVRVALSTDLNPGSSPTENLQLMIALGRAHLGLTPEEAILGVTRHAAAALNQEGSIGSLHPGARADVLILGTDHEIDLCYHYGVNPTRDVLRAGEPLVTDGRLTP